MRDNWLSNRIFSSYDEIVAICCEAWNRLMDQPWNNNVHRYEGMGTWVLINARWYYVFHWGNPSPQSIFILYATCYKGGA